MKEIRIVNGITSKQYDAIINDSRDINVDCVLWDYPLDEIEHIMESLEEMHDVKVMYLALINGRLYELPNDWEEVM